MAEKCNLSNNFIALLERGRNAPSLDTLEVLAQVFRVSISELFEFEAEVEKLSERERAMKRLKKIRNVRDWKLIGAVAEFLERHQR
ncbi:MAG TPA: helix-turn-helix transcriptional regulator [Bacteroidota bacterium]|nr:helix-turn-helix transcriptional regulator [Bacteroidota bacterium]